MAAALLPWFDAHGRKDLPWQQPATPYRVWISEVMLQQTQVATVIPYFLAFTARFPDVSTLAAAPVDDVLRHWSGLGYYARGRNLHRAAQELMARHGGRLPEEAAALEALPGIGRSTAGAIQALGHGRRAAILDGNVKRVLTRLHALPGWPGSSAALRSLWELAEAHTPSERVADYTQAIMDLGATLCTPKRPACTLCPLQPHCAAFAEGSPEAYPTPRPRRALPLRRTRLLLLRHPEHGILLERRPPTGIWGGLWSLPECDWECDPDRLCPERYGAVVGQWETWPARHHTFTHFRLEMTPLLGNISRLTDSVLEGGGTLWYKKGHSERPGLATPIRRLLDQLEHSDGEQR